MLSGMARQRSTKVEIQDREGRGVRLCPRCRLERTEVEFTPGNWKRGGGGWCRECNVTYNAARYAADPERFKAHERAKRRAAGSKERRATWTAEERKAKQRQYHLKQSYGLSLEEYAWLFHAQGFCCAICRSTNPGTKDWHVDHDHGTDEVRGILCHACNVGLGHFLDRPDLLRSGAQYIDNYRSGRVASAA